MKKVLLFLFAAISISMLLTNCKSGNAKSAKIGTSDTQQVFMVYFTEDQPDVRYDMGWRVIREAVHVDTTDKSLSWVTDTFYFRPAVDTVRDKITRQPIFDSVGKVKFERVGVPVLKKHVWDTDITKDSALSRFNEYMPDSLKFKLPK